MKAATWTDRRCAAEEDARVELREDETAPFVVRPRTAPSVFGALDAMGFRALALVTEGTALVSVHVDLVGGHARVALHAPGRTAPAGAGGATVLDAVEYLARDLGRADVVRWIAAQRAELDRAGGDR